ncbi:hypothetical protein BDC45DRAFT_557927 [Circinella umbellata]|nr:hypothetical protein BDC45DRAFT_557927 [Circinella umbellata]
MTSTDKLIFYGNRHSPYSQRVEIAFKEIEVKFDEIVNIDLSNKPSWLKGINPEEKISVVNIEGKNIAEFLVLLELAHDIKPEKNLLPTYTPLRPAQIRSAWPSYMQAFVDQTQCPAYIEYVEIHYNRLDEMLRRQSSTGSYFLGNDYSLADIALAPFIARNLAINKGFLGGYIPKPITDRPRLQDFVNGILSCPSFKETYIEDEAVVDDVASALGIKSPTYYC